jgi:hypothetical protein
MRVDAAWCPTPGPAPGCCSGCSASRALRLLYSGEFLGAVEAHQLGYVQALVAEDKLLQRASARVAKRPAVFSGGLR